MKKLFVEANINVENFNEAERKQKIKVKYYKLTASEVKEDEKKFGIALVKEENDGKKDVITEKIIESNLSNNENLIDNLLKILVNYQVTPVATGDIISDFKKCPELIFSMTK